MPRLRSWEVKKAKISMSNSGTWSTWPAWSVMFLPLLSMSFGIMMKRLEFWTFGYFLDIWFSGLQVISYYSNRGGLGGVSLVTLKGEETVSQLLIKDANEKDEVSVFIFHVCLKRGETVETNCFFRDPTRVILHVVLMQQLASLFLTVSDILFRAER